MTEVSSLGKFNKTVEQFMDALIERYDYHNYFGRELIKAKEKFLLLKRVNPQIVIEAFLKFVYPYKSQIMNEEEDFFANKNYQEDTDKEDHLVKVLKIKELYETDMDDNTKSTIFTFFKVLIILSENYVSEKI
jgi:hypothetical protein